jgi:hypothetical protein
MCLKRGKHTGAGCKSSDIGASFISRYANSSKLDISFSVYNSDQEKSGFHEIQQGQLNNTNELPGGHDERGCTAQAAPSRVEALMKPAGGDVPC